MATVNLAGGFALITGAASGIGKETGFTFAESGAAGVIFADIDESKAIAAAEESRKLATEPTYRALAVKVDVTSPDSVKSMVAFTLQQFGRIDYCVHSAGIDIATYFVPFSESPIDDYDKVMEVNAKGAFLVTQAASKQIALQEPRTVSLTRNRSRDLGRGCIVNGAYITSKHAVLGITKIAALEGGPLGIRVNCVCPSWVRTAMFEEECIRAPLTTEIIKAIISQGRPAEPKEVLESIAFLCSPASSYINGIGLIIDSGLTLTVHIG